MDAVVPAPNANAAANTHADAETNTHANMDTNTNPVTDSDREPDANADFDAYPIHDAVWNALAYSNPSSDSNPIAIAFLDAEPDT